MENVAKICASAQEIMNNKIRKKCMDIFLYSQNGNSNLPNSQPQIVPCLRPYYLVIINGWILFRLKLAFINFIFDGHFLFEIQFQFLQQFFPNQSPLLSYIQYIFSSFLPYQNGWDVWVGKPKPYQHEFYVW